MVGKEEKFYERIINPDVYHYPNVNWDIIKEDIAENVKLSASRKIRYFECPIAFDIETTSFETEDMKCACMYAWVFSINGHVILGRTWSQVQEVYEKLIEIFKPNDTNRILIYIQNLAYEFQFICKRFEWKRVFALKERKPISCVTTENLDVAICFLVFRLPK